MKNHILIIIIVALSSCKEVKKMEVEPNEIVEIPKNVDNDFNAFLEFFSNDSTFQISRVNFPMKVENLNMEDGTLNEKIILLSDYYLKRFIPYNPKNTDYTQEVVIKNEEALILIRGKENGLVVDYVFKKNNGKWKLITWTDQST